MGLWYPKDSGFELTAFSDADHAGCIDTRKSTSGGIQFLGDKLVSWMSKKQNCTAMSIPAEAEWQNLQPPRRALIDVYEGELTLRVGKEAVTFNLDQTLRYSSNYDDNSVNRIDVIEMDCSSISNSSGILRLIMRMAIPLLLEYCWLVSTDMIEKTMEFFMDAFSGLWEFISQKIASLEWNKMLKRCEDTNLCLNWEKSHFMVKEGIVLGHKISKNRIEVDKAKVDVIANIPSTPHRQGDHNLWDVIVNGDLEEEPAPTTGETSTPPAPKTAKQLAARRNQERVKSILLLVIPDEYLLKFHNVADAKSL
ncbi:hypothetical protein Tco_0270458 [Tanacetum coccineum]